MRPDRVIVDMTGTAPPPQWGVAIDYDAIETLAGSWAGTAFEVPRFDYPGTPERRDESWWFDYVTLSVSVLACLWPPAGDEVWHVRHDDVWLDDAPGIFAAFSRMLEPDTANGYRLDLERFATMTDAQAADLFAGKGTLQLIPERAEILRTVATTLLERWDGSARNMVHEAERNGTQIVRLLTETVPGYLDRPTTPAGVAHFDKLSHLSAAIMAAGVGWASAGFSGFDEFPVYPDYMLPRVFRHFGAMVYDQELAQRVDHGELIERDSVAEYGIRWATVHCGAQLSAALAERGTLVTGPALDYKLWSIAVLGPDQQSFGEHHRTLTLSY